MMEPFPPLPVEIIRMIMEASAGSSPANGAILTCLCREICRWIIPILYRTIVVSSMHQVSTLCHTLQRQDFASHIRNLAMTCVHSGVSMEYEHAAVLEKCIHLESLLLALSPPSQSDAGPTRISWPTPQQVILTRAHMKWVRHPMLQNVTHLSLRGFNLDGSFVNTCRSLTQLTHARCWFFPEDLRALWLEKLLSLNPRLHMVLATVRSSLSHITPFTLTGEPWITLAGNKDDRLFVGVASWDLESDLTLLEPGDDVWAVARAMLKDWREWVKRHPVVGYCLPSGNGNESEYSRDELELEV